MFTGIIESQGKILEIKDEGSNKTYSIQSGISNLLKVDQSVAHDGVCLTVTHVEGNIHQVTAIAETLNVSALRFWEINSCLNLERCLQMNGRIDGHFVQGHVDATGQIISIQDMNGSFLVSISIPDTHSKNIIQKGSIAVNGISLTCFNVTRSSFDVAIIPFTWEHTNMKNLKQGLIVNLEFDMIGKHILRNLELQMPA